MSCQTGNTSSSRSILSITNVGERRIRAFRNRSQPCAHASRSLNQGFDFLLAFFFAAFFRGIFAPAPRASLSAIAMACFRSFTLRPLPDLSFPSLCSFMTLWILRAPLEVRKGDFFVAMQKSRQFRFQNERGRTRLRLRRVRQVSDFTRDRNQSNAPDHATSP